MRKTVCNHVCHGIALVLLVVPALAFAHEGHAAPGLAHDLHHASWLVFAAAAVIAVVVAVVSARDREEP